MSQPNRATQAAERQAPRTAQVAPPRVSQPQPQPQPQPQARPRTSAEPAARRAHVTQPIAKPSSARTQHGAPSMNEAQRASFASGGLPSVPGLSNPGSAVTQLEVQLTGDELRAETGLKPARAIGGSLNALVRQTVLYRKGVERGAKVEPGGISDTQRQLAERVARAWRRAIPSALDFEATRVTCGGDLALEADAEHNQWVLFAFMAGVRRIEPRPAMTASDVLRLVQELVALVPSVRSIGQFRDWLDADGAEGFEVRVHTSFREVIEEIDIEEEREFGNAFAMARFEAPRSGDAVYIAARDLDMVAMRKEFEVPIEMYAADTMAAALGGMSDDDLEQIGKRCDDANAWSTAEIEAVLAIPELRSAITPEHMARRVVTRLSSEADEQFLMLLTKLNAKADPFRQAVARALGTQEVGEIIARQLKLDDEEHVEALGKFLVLSPPNVSQAVMGGMLERASDQPSAKTAVMLLAEWYGGAQTCEWVLAQLLNEETAATLGGALSRVPAAPAELSHVLGGANAESAVALLRGMPSAALTELGRPVRLLWSRAKPELAEEVVELMIKSRAADNLKLLGDLLLEGKADKWKGRTLYALCAGLIEAGLGRSHLLAVAQKRDASEQTRLIALDCLRNDDALAEEVCKFRFGGVFDSSAIKERIREIAKARKG